MVKAKREAKARGPQSPLADDPHVEKVKKFLHERGYRTLSEAAKDVGFGLSQLSNIIRDGLSADPKQSTVERLRKLGILDIVPRRDSA